MQRLHISSLDQADLALQLLMVNASEGGIEGGMGCEGSTQVHMQLEYCTGLLEAVVAVNKMDRLVWSVCGGSKQP